jgi:hypothetical protein
MVCLGYVCINALHKRDNDDNNSSNNNNNNNNNKCIKEVQKTATLGTAHVLYYNASTDVKRSSPVTGLEWPRVFQEVKVSRFLDKGTGLW